jgi:hypothetical protein
MVGGLSRKPNLTVGPASTRDFRRSTEEEEEEEEEEEAILAQSFSPFSSRDGRQVCCPDPTRATNLFSKIEHKLVAQIQLGRQTCRPSCAKKGLKDWANVTILTTCQQKNRDYLKN